MDSKKKLVIFIKVVIIISILLVIYLNILKPLLNLKNCSYDSSFILDR